MYFYCYAYVLLLLCMICSLYFFIVLYSVSLCCFVCKCTLPLGVNPIKDSKYIYLYITLCIGINDAETKTYGFIGDVSRYTCM